PTVDVAVSRRMGLFVVARLAARHGIRVRLRPAPARGLSGLVWLPPEAITPDSEKGSLAPPRPGWKPFGDRAIAGAAGFTTGTGDPGDITPLWDAGQGLGNGRDSSTWASRPVALREDPDMADSGQYPDPDDGAIDTQSWRTTGPLPKRRSGPQAAASGPLPTRTGPVPPTGNRMRAVGLGTDGGAYGGPADLREEAPRGTRS